MTHVLVVEDDRDVRSLLELWLAEVGYDVTGAGDGGEALDVLEGTAIDAIVTDVMMPGVDGLELIRRVRERGLRMPVLAVTGYATPQILTKRDDVRVIRHAVNRGYGQSLIDAFCYAQRKGYDWVITMDCDEQHEPERIPEFIRQI